MNLKKSAVIAAMLGAGAIGGGLGSAIFSTGAASAQTSTPAATTQQAPAGAPGGPGGNFDPSKGGHQANGITEALLTGDDATKATAAAKAAVPGATIERVETDAEGAAYEAHVVKSDGSHATVKMDKNFKVTSVEDGAR